MNHEELYLTYNLDYLINLYDHFKEISHYTGFLDEETTSADFVNHIMDNLYFYDTNMEDETILDDDGVIIEI